jgi:hypothetical protein
MSALSIRRDRTPTVLRKVAKGESDARIARRILAIANALAGMSREEAAKSAGMDVRPVNARVFSRRQTCRGNSQAPRSLDSRVEGNQDSEAYRQNLPWGDHELPGRNENERNSSLENA